MVYDREEGMEGVGGGGGGAVEKEGSKWRPSLFWVKVFAVTINDVSVKPVISIMFFEVHADKT